MTQRLSHIAVIGAAFVGLFLLMPLIAVIPVSFTPKRFLSLPDGALSLRHYKTLVETPQWWEATVLSVQIALFSGLLATALALAFSLGIWMLRPRFAGLLIGLALLPMVAPPVVSALTLYFFLVSAGKLNALIGYDSWLGVVLAHTVMVVPFAVVLISVSLAQVDRRIDLAARAMGAGLARRINSVLLPNIRFGVLTAFFLSFVLSWEEIGVTIFITSVNVVTLPRLMWMGLRDNIDPAIAAVSVVLICIVVMVILTRALILAMGNRRRKKT
ncbi:ABC transporter permease [Roseobacter weihaiensis]|uniref:ABC transporter permease n=1 Tax=Roseobacter weihaiensis TaxID=2763262 RepID=UPI001D0ABAF6|nr:ABC transporter permease [Roseobacter sp. H9]